jgi:hypothetical protein
MTSEKPWKVVVAFLGVFVAGAIFGGFFTVGIGAHWLRKMNGGNGARPHFFDPAADPKASGRSPHPLLQMNQSWQAPQLMRRYAERLDLSAEQKDRINPLIQRASEDYNHLRQNTFRETAQILRRLQQDIARELTPDQREKLEDMEKNQRDMLRRFEQWRAEQRKAFGDRGPVHEEVPHAEPSAEGAPQPHDVAPATAPEPSSADATVPPPHDEKKQ